MGAVLEKPNTEKETIRVDGNDMSAGISSMQGWRLTMEDTHSAIIGLPNDEECCWFAVFDGHGGILAAEIADKHVIEHIQASEHYKDHQYNPEAIKKAIYQGFLALDDFIRKEVNANNPDDISGCTCISVFLTPKHVICGNIGDSRAILIRNHSAIALSDDHKPTNPEESRRIRAAGGEVILDRVNGDLAVSRALGDFSFKTRTDLPATEQLISPEPDFEVVDRDNESDEFLVIACDGVWDVMDNNDVAQYICEKYAEGVTDTGKLSEMLIDRALELNSRDNLSAIVVTLPASKKIKTTPPAYVSAPAVEEAESTAPEAAGPE